MNEKIATKFGTAKLNEEGYYSVGGRPLHRLIFEDFYNCEIPKNYVIDHKNRIKTDNCILNLQLLPRSEHGRIHSLGRKMSKEAIEKIRQGRIGEKSVWWGKKHSIQSRMKISEAQTSTGFYGVNKHKDKDCFNGFYWEYLYYENGKQRSLCSVDFFKLKKKVKSKGKIWKIVNEELAKQTMAEVKGLI